MSKDIYHQLRDRIEQYSHGYPPSYSGVEIKFLQKICSEEEAEMYLHLSDKLETAEEVAKRAKQDPRKVAAILKRMTEKGLTFPKRKGDTIYYTAAPYCHGIHEHQLRRLRRMDRDLAQLMEEYMLAGKIGQMSTSTGLRIIPVKAPINISRALAPYEDVERIIKGKDRIALADCVCAVHQLVLGKSCKQPVEICLLFGFYAEYYVSLGMARSIGREEALEALDLAEEAGLVHQAPNMLDPEAICNCCGSCCGGLRILRMLPNPAAWVVSNYFCQVDPKLCSGCEVCVDRCPMYAITMGPEKTVMVNLDRCIGCGLCINKCPTEALTLMSKPEEARQVPPRTSPFMRPSEDIESSIHS